MYLPWSVARLLGEERRKMTTTAGVSVSDNGGGNTAASPPNLLTSQSTTTNGQRMQPLPTSGRTHPGDDERPSPASDPQQARLPFLIDVSIRCTVPSCSCDCFSPCKSQIRTCDGCGHGWVSHALDKLGFRHLFNCHQVEIVQPSIAFDIASLMLYGTQAVPVRLKILLDRLFSVLREEQVLQVLHGFGWTNEDYTRGYIIQETGGRGLDKWLMATREEEPLILQQFLRFGETKTVAQQLLLQDTYDKPEFVANSTRIESDIKKFIDRTNRSSSCTSVVANTKLNSYSVSALTHSLSLRQPSSSVSSTHSISPTAMSPVNNCSSPISVSPLNKLQSMQPHEFRRDRSSPERLRSSEPLNMSSTVYSSPSSSPGTATPAVSMPAHLSSSMPLYHQGSSDSDLLASDDEDSSSAINLSRSDARSGGYLDSIFAAKKVRHLRKSANPMKRRWNTMMLSSLSTNPSTGKKRVQCHVCMKTFCDKGALKIHFSAVHLREMHKCTVDGCSMMFSSRRSRNRHSANPNPKLHTPNYRRKINPHDGRSANPYPLIPPTPIHGFNNSLMPGSMPNHFDGDSNTASEVGAGHPNFMKNGDYLPHKNENEKSVGDCPKDSVSHSTINNTKQQLPDDVPLSLTKKRRVEDGIPQLEETSNGESEGINLSLKEDHVTSSIGVRKRKSLNPTKCRISSDDDLQYVSTDDTSSDTYIDQDNEENGLLDSKSDLSSDDLDSKDEDNYDLKIKSLRDLTDRNTSGQFSSSSSPPSHFPTSVSTTSGPLTSPVISGSQALPKYFSEKQNGYLNSELNEIKREMLRNRAQENEDISENPLRHLESLSLGSFASIMNNSSRNNFKRSGHMSSGVSYHAPGLGLGSAAVTTTAPIRMDSPPVPTVTTTSDHIAHQMNHSRTVVTPPSSQQLSGGHVNSDPENSLQDQMSLMPVYRDASMISSVEIPVDKDNPRRCTACGKIFQNHFGVKTHYQNVHLKLMHNCTVEGCNAAFPSKRSRDRHSANLNLHRKLLSTSSDKPSAYFEKGAIYPYPPDAAIRGEFFSRLYDPQTLPLSFADLYHSRLTAESGFLGGTQYPTHLLPGFHPALMFPPAAVAPRRLTTDGLGSGRDSPISSTSSPELSPRPQANSPRREPSVKLEEDLKPDPEGRYACDICDKKFHESIVLREHYEKCHSKSLLKCVEDGCNQVFLSGRTRNLHTDELHKEKVIEAS